MHSLYQKKKPFNSIMHHMCTEQKPIFKTMYGHLSCCKNNFSEINSTHNNDQYLNTMVDTDALLCE